MQTLPIDSNTWIIADTHFGHENINIHEPIRKQQAYQNGFSSSDEYMIYQWNSIVKEGDTVFHLGDFAFKHKDIKKLSERLNGDKILLVGNHDKDKDTKILKSIGVGLVDSVMIDVKHPHIDTLTQKTSLSTKEQRLLCCYVCDIDNKRVMFTHFPLFDDNPYDESYKPITSILESIYTKLQCDINIHGHTHSKGAKEDFCISACVELNDFKPKRLRDILSDFGK